ncbi:MAG: HK97 family phage prohead protease [Bryobacteraceae bacterium]
MQRFDFEGAYLERLDMSPEAVDLSQLRGAPVLDNHDRFGGVSAILGVVESAAVDGKRGVATVRFGVREQVKGIVADVRSGVIRNVSAGYTVQQWAVSKRADGARVKTATRWTPKEVSFVPLGADPRAQVRNSHGEEMDLQTQLRSIAEAVGVPVAFAEGLAQREGMNIQQGRAAIIAEAARQQPIIDTRPPARFLRKHHSPRERRRSAFRRI